MSVQSGFLRGWVVLPWSVTMVSLSAVPAGAQTADELLDQLEKRREQVTTLYQVTKTTAREGDTVRESNIRTWEKRSGNERRTRVASTTKTSKKGEKESTETETLTVSDGRYEWRQARVNDKIMVFKAQATSTGALKVLREAASDRRFRLTGREYIERQPCVVLEARDEKGRDRAKATYWVSESHGVILKSKAVIADGGDVEMTTLEFKVGEAIEDGKFVYNVPEGAVVIDTDAIGAPADKQAKP